MINFVIIHFSLSRYVTVWVANLYSTSYSVSFVDLKTDNLDRVSIPRKIVATFDVEHPIHGTTYGPKWCTEIGKYWQNIHCSTCVYYLNLIVNYLNTVQIAQIQAYNFECSPCSDAISGPMNWVFDIKSGHDFCRYRNSIEVIYFQINGVFPKERPWVRGWSVWLQGWFNSHWSHGSNILKGQYGEKNRLSAINFPQR